jgi:DNA polymerase III sliding clamp (beta) subunit (PCNA family)
MEIKRAELLHALTLVEPGLQSQTENIETRPTFIFEDEKVFTYNDTLCFQHPIKSLDFSGAIASSEFIKLLNKLKSDIIQLKKNKNELLLEAGKVKAGFTFQEDLPSIREILTHDKWKTIPDDFIEGLRFVLSSCQGTPFRIELANINVKSSGRLESSDNYFVSTYDVGKTRVKTFGITIPSAKVLVTYPLVKIAEGENWIHFKTEEGTILSCRIVAAEFPSIDKALNVNGQKLKLPPNIQKILERAAVFCTQAKIEEKFVTIFIKKERIKVRAETGNFAWFEEERKTTYTGKEFTFGTNPELLNSILVKTRRCTMSNHSLKFVGNKWQYVTALIGE